MHRIRSSRFNPAQLLAALGMAITLTAHGGANDYDLNPQTIAKAADTDATKQAEVVRIGWSRDDVEVTVDGAPLPPAAGLGSWAAFKSSGDGEDTIVAGDTVVFQDEVDAAMDAAFAHNLKVTALHNHFFYDQPKAYFMHIAGRGSSTELAAGVKAVWDAIKQVRADNPQPATSFPGNPPARNGDIDPLVIATTTGLEAEKQSSGVVKVSAERPARMEGTDVGGRMGLSSWAAFSGNMESASIDGDFIMTAAEVQPVLKRMREVGFHVVALHNHMIGETPPLYFTHFWAKGEAGELAQGFRAVLDTRSSIGQR